MLDRRAGSNGFAVIGCGAVGLSCALHLQRLGAKVEIFDPRGPGEGASLGNAGVVALSEVLPLSRPAIIRQVPRMLLDSTGPLVIRPRYALSIAPWLIRFLASSRASQVHRISTALASLLGLAVDAWKDLVDDTPGRSLLARNGHLRAFSSDAARQAAMPDIERQRALGIAVDVIGPGDLHDLEPALARVFAGAAFYRGAANVLSPLTMMQALAASFVERGGILHKREVARIEAKPGDAAQVHTVDGEAVRYDGVVIAAGAWSRQLVRTLGVDVPLDTERGYHAMLPTPATTLKRPVSIPSPGYSLVQMTDGLRITSGVEFAGLSAPPDFRRLRRMIAHATTALPGLSPQPTSEWLGFRPSMPWSLPVIGPLPDRQNVMLAFGHGHVGLTLGPITGQIVAALANGGKAPVDMAPFLPRPSAYRGLAFP